MNLCKKCQCEYIGNACRPCANIVAAEYRKNNKEKMRVATDKWKAENPEKVKAAAKRVFEKRKLLFPALEAERARVAQNKWAKNNPDKVRAIKAKTTKKNKHAIDAKARERTKKWKMLNKEQVIIQNHNKRARTKAAFGKLSAGLAHKLLLLQKYTCACGCGGNLNDGYHLDHRMPIALGGANEDSNIQLLTAKCNLQKHKKHPIEFMRSRGFLL